ncbi:Hypothetical predicted protein [Olea europaea subsp. europaea]|uniref:Uncharacterized protein n=1 Tax=Olea europaea subsp. europaea TaxID=158383 RepID=A0A8S0VPJ2_OLEEU|nr:Hypothetical predicted protein [Olea europaea subsp. europaea]
MYSKINWEAIGHSSKFSNATSFQHSSSSYYDHKSSAAPSSTYDNQIFSILVTQRTWHSVVGIRRVATVDKTFSFVQFAKVYIDN